MAIIWETWANDFSPYLPMQLTGPELNTEQCSSVDNTLMYFSYVYYTDKVGLVKGESTYFFLSFSVFLVYVCITGLCTCVRLNSIWGMFPRRMITLADACPTGFHIIAIIVIIINRNSDIIINQWLKWRLQWWWCNDWSQQCMIKVGARCICAGFRKLWMSFKHHGWRPCDRDTNGILTNIIT